jgi:hypothetical protein
MTRTLFAVLCAVSLTVGAAIASLLITGAAPAPMQEWPGGPGWDVPGYDYARFEPEGWDYNTKATNCYKACDNDGKCRAAAFVDHWASQSGKQECFLKSAVAPRVLKSGVTAYVKVIESGRQLYNIDMPGWDYSRIELDQPDVNLCTNACRNDGHCASWTYVNPGVQGPKAACYLKSGLPNYKSDHCCVSGRIR